MRTTILAATTVLAVALIVPPRATGQSWGFPGLSNQEFAKVAGDVHVRRKEFRRAAWQR